MSEREKMEERETAQQDRYVALMSMNREKIEQYSKKYGLPIPDDEAAFWAAVHMLITSIAGYPLERRLWSKRWLLQRGYDSLDEGLLDGLLLAVLLQEAEAEVEAEKEKEQASE